MNKKELFISKHKDEVIKATQGTGLFPSVKMAQMIIESGWGESAPVKYGNNYFGIKADSSWKGEKIELNTPKDAKKKNYFRKYNSALDSIKDHSSFLIKNKRYENAGVFKAKTAEEQIDAIAKGGYAEAKDYSKVIKSIIDSNNLKSLDKEKPTVRVKKGIDVKTVFIVSIGIVVSYIVYIKFIRK